MEAAEKFWSYVDKDSEGGCWIWQGLTNTYGYGVLWNMGSNRYAHRFSYELHYGAIPAETLDHLCRIRCCVNPSHLEPVSRRENIRRASEHHWSGRTYEHMAVVRLEKQDRIARTVPNWLKDYLRDY